MALAKQRIMPCLWFDTEAENARELLLLGLQEFAHHRDQPLRQ